MNDIRLEILRASHLEHEKVERDLSVLLPVDHPKRIKIRDSANDIIGEIQKITKDHLKK